VGLSGERSGDDYYGYTNDLACKRTRGDGLLLPWTVQSLRDFARLSTVQLC